MGFFRTRAKSDPPDVERRVETLFLMKHKKKPDMNETFEINSQKLEEAEEQELQKQPPLKQTEQ